MIGVLYEVPAPLRAVALATRGLIHKLFPEGLRLLASRGAAPSFDVLVADLAKVLDRLRSEMLHRVGLADVLQPRMLV